MAITTIRSPTLFPACQVFGVYGNPPSKAAMATYLDLGLLLLADHERDALHREGLSRYRWNPKIGKGYCYLTSTLTPFCSLLAPN